MTDDLKTYDLVVIGGGPAGITAATAASTFGKNVALMDCHQQIGGAGVNTGTVPSKTLRETALALSGFKSRNLYGVDLSLQREVTVADFLCHEEHVKDAFHASITQRLGVLKAAIYCGTSTFLDTHTVHVRLGAEDGGKDASAYGGEIVLRGEKILVATGSSPVRPDLFPFGHGEIYDSDTILTLDRIPKTLAVVGAGVVGLLWIPADAPSARLGRRSISWTDAMCSCPFWMRKFPTRWRTRLNAAGSFFTGRKRC